MASSSDRVAPLRYLDGVNLADEVRDGNVRRRQLLRVALVAPYPSDVHVVALVAQLLLALRAYGVERVAIQLATRHSRNRVVHQIHHVPNEAGLRLPALAKQDDVLPREDGVLQLRNHRVVEPHDARKQRLTLADAPYQILANLRLDRQNLVAGFSQVADSAWSNCDRHGGKSPHSRLVRVWLCTVYRYSRPLSATSRTR